MPLKTGEPVPWFQANTHTTVNFQFSLSAGRYIALTFFGSAARADGQRLIQELEENRDQFDDNRVAFFGVTIDPEDIKQNRIQEKLPGIRFFQDFHGRISQAFEALPKGLDAFNAQADLRPVTYLLDQRLRLLETIPIENDGAGHIAKILSMVDQMPDLGEAVVADVQAPVLIVPRIFEPEFCQKLIGVYEKQGGEASGFMRDENGKTTLVHDYGTKRRKDVVIHDEDLRSECMHRIHDRLAPEIHKAFQFRASRMERYIVSCYESEEAGHFRAHRDNTTRGTAHRRFAVSLNLNTEDYEGGFIWFPEFGRHLYKPPTGGAVVFSCSLLHEATPVTSGQRYVFLPFLYDEAAAKVREENLQYLADRS
jgi:predicted 2-oxoglutarate/Fe(II)-dependent dioxygenase YbiX/peroxiredoxin